ncbi:MAG TPA: methionyl-tRNA formyltransferase [Thermoanaerobaculia bacterium]|jgi:methionyl-tRNA formyltransferase|nr:methionyl-tRNA formyltransferase [Thermoanaerobaculia bacterium]
MAAAPIERIVFFGTPEFAVPTLAALVAAGRKPACVVTQPARPVGRGQKVQDPPVAAWARERGLPVVQPEKVRDPAFLETTRELAPDVAVVVAFGQIFPRDLLALPRLGCVNVHASLLPRWRGAAPIQAAIAAGDRVTGVTTMLMEAGLDTGPMLLEEETEIRPDETADELSRRLAEMGGRLLVRTLERLEAGDLEPRPQDAAAATYAPRLTREDGRVDWTRPAREIADRLRAFTPWPGQSAMLGGEPVKLVRVEVLQEGVGGGEAAPGTFLGVRDGRLAVVCGGGSVLGLAELQRPGRKPLKGADFANGERLRAGDLFS